jgi:hypothetical protein
MSIPIVRDHYSTIVIVLNPLVFHFTLPLSVYMIEQVERIHILTHNVTQPKNIFRLR